MIPDDIRRVRNCMTGIYKSSLANIMNRTVAILLPILFSEPTNLVWMGRSDNGACASMTSGQYCTCGAVKEPDEFVCRSRFRPDTFDNASCLRGTITRWTQQHTFWLEHGFACMPPASPSSPPPATPPPSPIPSVLHCIWDLVRRIWT